MEAFAFFSAFLGVLLQPVLCGLGVFVTFRILQYLRAKKEHDQQVLQELQEIKDHLQRDKSNPSPPL